MSNTEDIGEYKMNFGKYSGEELQIIWLVDKKYLRWISETFENSSSVKMRVDEFLEEQE